MIGGVSDATARAGDVGIDRRRVVRPPGECWAGRQDDSGRHRGCTVCSPGVLGGQAGLAVSDLWRARGFHPGRQAP